MPARWFARAASLAVLALLIFPAAAAAQPVTTQPAEKAKAAAPPPQSLPPSWVENFKWRCIGPANMGGRITAVSVYEKDPCMMWVATASGGLLKTVNNGVTFEHQFDRESTVSIGDVAVAQSDPNIVWVGTGEHNPRNSVSWGDGVYKSVDGGKTWKNMGLKDSFQIGRISIHPTDPNIVYVGALGRLWGPNEQRGLYKTTDAGKNWERILFIDDKTGVIDVVMKPGDPETLLAATYERQRDAFDGDDPAKKWGPGSGLHKTTDGGKTWRKITKGLPTCNVGRIGLDYYHKDSNIVYMVLESEQIGNEPENAPYAGLRGQDADAGAKLTDITKDGPADKAGLEVDDIVLSVNDVTVHSYNDLLKEIRKHLAGDKVKVEVSRKRKSEIFELAFVKRPQPGQPPTSQPGPPTSQPGPPTSQPGPPTSQSGPQASQPVPPTSQPVPQTSQPVPQTSQPAPPAFQPASQPASPTSQPERRRQAGRRRPPQAAGQQRDRPGRGPRRRRPPFGSSLGGQRENMQEQQGPDGHEFGGLYRSTDGGETWERINSVNPRPMYFSKVRVDPSDNNHIYVLGISLYRSKDGGKTFTSDGGRGVHVDHHAMWVDPKDGRHIILGNDGGLYVTYDRMEKWDHLNHVAIGQFYHVGVDSRRNYRVYGGLQDNGSWGGPSRVRHASGPGNEDWFRIGGGDGFLCVADPEDPDQIYYESQNGSMGRTNLRTGERGSVRPPRQRGGPRYRFNWRTPFLLSSHNSRIHYSAGNFVFRSVNRGQKIKTISPEITRTQRGSATALAESHHDPDVLYVGTDDGALWVTRNGGHEWHKIVDFPDDTKAPTSQPGGEATTQAADKAGSAPTSQEATTRSGRRGGRMLERIKEMDANKDGKLQRSEVSGRWAGFFDRMDANGDGVVDGAELKRMSERMGGRRPPGERGRGEGRRRGPPPTGDDPILDPDAAMMKTLEASGGNIELVGHAVEPASAHRAEVAPSALPNEPPPDKTPDSKADQASAPEQPRPQASKQPAKQPPAADAKPTASHAADQPETPDSGEPPSGATTSAPAEQASTQPTAEPKKIDPITGLWNARILSGDIPPERAEFEFTLKLEAGNKVSGTYSSTLGEGALSAGRFNPETGALAFEFDSGRFVVDYAATVRGSKMTGNAVAGTGWFEFDFEATRSETPATSASAGKEAARDDGYDWKPLTELLPGPRWVSSIETSRAKAGRVYVTFDAHRSNDDEPYIFVSEDTGKTWRSIRANLPSSAGTTRVIREDIESENVLYLGTEFGAWVSIDRGESWTKLSGNLPTVAVHEIALHPTAGEIVAATHGRSLWILDATPLRQMSKEVVKEDLHLFEPSTAIYWRSEPRRGGGGARRYTGQNPPSEAQIFYSLGKRPRRIKLVVTDLAGETIRELEAEPEPGLHRVSWDLRRPPEQPSQAQAGRGRGRSGQSERFGRFRRRGRPVPSGTYLVKLSVDDRSMTRQLEVNTDPDYPDYRAWEQEAPEHEPSERASEETGRVGDMEIDR